MCSKTIPMASGVWKIWYGRALDIILVGPYGSHLYAGESASSILLYCSAPKGVSEISWPGSRFTVMSCCAAEGDQRPLKSRTHFARSAGEFGPVPCAVAIPGAATRTAMAAAMSMKIGKRLLIVEFLSSELNHRRPRQRYAVRHAVCGLAQMVSRILFLEHFFGGHAIDRNDHLISTQCQSRAGANAHSLK